MIVGVSTDELVKKEKKKTPVISFKDRMEIIKGIKYVDAVVQQTTLDKTELIKKLAKTTGLSLKDAGMAVSAIFDAEPGKGIIAIELDAGKKVTLPGFGTFKTVHRKARTGINPKTKASITIPAKNYAVFKAGKTLKDRVSK